MAYLAPNTGNEKPVFRRLSSTPGDLQNGSVWTTQGPATVGRPCSSCGGQQRLAVGAGAAWFPENTLGRLLVPKDTTDGKVFSPSDPGGTGLNQEELLGGRQLRGVRLDAR